MESEEIVFCDLCNESIPKNAPYAIARGKKVCSKCLAQLAPSIPERREGLGPPPEAFRDIRPWGMGPLRAGFLGAIGQSLWYLILAVIVTGVWMILFIILLLPLVKETLGSVRQYFESREQQEQGIEQLLRGIQPGAPGTGGTMEELLPELFPEGKAPEAPFEEAGATGENFLEKEILLAQNNRRMPRAQKNPNHL